jgi:hypothetical protein
VAIRNTGQRPARLALSQSGLADFEGPNGGRLSQALRLEVRDVGSARTVYSGPFASMPRSDAGSLNPGQSRTYELSAHLPRSEGNGAQASTAKVRYVWTATEAGTTAAPPAATPPAPTAPCVPSLRVPAGQHLLKRRRMVARVRVSRTCRVTVRGLATDRGARRRYLYGVRDRLLAAGQTHRISLRSSRAVRRVLQRRRHRIVRVQVRAGSRTVSRRASVR